MAGVSAIAKGEVRMAARRTDSDSRDHGRSLTMSDVAVMEHAGEKGEAVARVSSAIVGSPEDFAVVLKTVQDAARDWGSATT